MDLSTIIGMISGMLFVVFAVVSASSFADMLALIDVPSLLVTFGGMLCATAVSLPTAVIKNMGRVGKKLVIEDKHDPMALILQLVNFAEIARRDGILALESSIREIKDEFMVKGIQLAVDGTDPELIRDTMTTELEYMQERHAEGKKIYENLGKYGPAFGMIGTLIGLVLMLKSLDDPSTIGPKMAVAIITTFYGALGANLFFLPFADKLELRSNEESMIKEIVIVGVMSIQSGDNPRIVEQKLMIFLPPNLRQFDKPDEG